MDTRILKGPDYHVELPKEPLGKLVYDCLLKFVDQPAFVDEYSGESLTYKRVLEITCQLARVYENIGLETGDLIGIYSENSIYYYLPMFAAMYLGITTVPISHYYLENELTHALNLTKPSVLFCSKRNYKEFLKIRKQFSFIRYIIVTDFEESTEGVDNFTTIFNKYSSSDFMDLHLKELDVNKTVVLVLFSSGTTGLPKGVVITQKNYISRMVHTWDPRLRYFDPKDVILGVLPFYHAAGMISFTGGLLLGNSIRVFWKFEERKFLQALQDYHLTTIGLVPPLVVFLAKSPIVDEYDLSSLTDIIVGGAALSENIEKRLVERLKVKYIRQVYGMTETTLNATCVPVNVWKRGSAGKLVPGMMAAIRDLESGDLLGPHQVGEVILKGDMVMAGYYKNPEATKEIFLENGFIKSGDLGYYDEEEHFFIVDRLKELIKYKGFQVAPAELEGLLLKHPKILDAGVVGVPNEEAGELPLAFIVKQPTAQDLTQEEIIKYISDNVSHQKRLRGGVRFIDAIPKNGSGKILRRELRKMTTKSKL